MDRRAMPLPRIPEMRLPSFRELNESIETDKHNNPNRPSPGPSSSYPAYPANRWHVEPDPSENVFREPRIRPERVEVDLLPESDMLSNRELPPPIPELLPLQLRRDERSPINRLPSIRIVPMPSPSTQVSSTSELSPNPPRPALGNRYDLRTTPRRREQSPDPAPSNRAQRRRISVNFSEVAAHTAKCDECNKRNRNGMARCQTCGWQLCRKCQSDRNGDRTHGSIGATHVADGGGYPSQSMAPVNAAPAEDRQYRENSEDVRAAHTLLELASHGNLTPRAAGGVGSNGDMAPPRSRVFEQQVDVSPTDSQMTVSMVEGDEWPNDDNEIPIGEDGLPIGYVITRRNPARAARPSTMME